MSKYLKIYSERWIIGDQVCIFSFLELNKIDRPISSHMFLLIGMLVPKVGNPIPKIRNVPRYGHS